MSKHRDLVREATDAMTATVLLPCMSEDDVLLHASLGEEESVVRVPVATDSRSPFVRTLERAVASYVGEKQLDDFEWAELRFGITESSRIATCVVGGLPPSQRVMKVFTLKARATIRTRWVHMFSDWERVVERPASADTLD
jgi:hypothetical protein